MKFVIPLFAFAALVTGCSHAPVKTDNAGAEVSSTPPKLIEPKIISENPDLKMVHFAVNQSVLTTKAKQTLNEDAAILKKDSDLKFQVQGFCDDRGTVPYNMALGERRAEAVKNYLEKQGVDASRISIVSFGKADPLDAHETEAAYKLNRRASFAIGTVANTASR